MNNVNNVSNVYNVNILNSYIKDNLNFLAKCSNIQIFPMNMA